MSEQSPKFAVQAVVILVGFFLFAFDDLLTSAEAQMTVCPFGLEDVVSNLNTVDMEAFDPETDTITMGAGTTKRLKFGYAIPEVQVENPEVVRATPVSRNEFVVSGLRPGISILTVWNKAKEIETIEIHVEADVSKLQQSLKLYLPNSHIEVEALQRGIVLTGEVLPPDTIEMATSIARDYFPTDLINRLHNGNPLHVDRKVLKVSRPKLNEFKYKDSKLQIKSVADLLPPKTKTANEKNGSESGIATPEFIAHISALQGQEIANVILNDNSLMIQRPAESLGAPFGLTYETKSAKLGDVGATLELDQVSYSQERISQKFRVDFQNAKQTKRKLRFVPNEKVNVGQTLVLVIDCPSESGNTEDYELVFLFTPKLKHNVAAKPVTTKQR